MDNGQYNPTKKGMIVIAIIIIILIGIPIIFYFIDIQVSKDKGITALEGKEIADEIANKWNTNAILIEVIGGQVDSNGKCQEWRYVYTNSKLKYELEIHVFEDGTSDKYLYERYSSYQPILIWSIDSNESIDIAKKNSDINKYLSKYKNAYIESMQFSRGINSSSPLICAIWWIDSGFIDNPHNAHIKINAETGEILEVDI